MEFPWFDVGVAVAVIVVTAVVTGVIANRSA